MRYHLSKDDTTNYVSARFLHINAIGTQSHALFDYTVFREGGRDDYHLLYIREGACTVLYGAEKTVLHGGGFVLYPPRVTQRYTFFAADAARSDWLHFSGSAAEEMLKEAGLSCGVFHLPPDESISAAFREMINKNLLNAGTLAETASLLSFLDLLGRRLRGCRGNPFEHLLLKMAEDIGKPYDGTRYAALCALSESRFAHKFKEYMGLSPHSYFFSLKLARAKELLISSSLSVGEIAETVGFDNPLYFSRLFKRYVGCSPLIYKKQHS